MWYLVHVYNAIEVKFFILNFGVIVLYFILFIYVLFLTPVHLVLLC